MATSFYLCHFFVFQIEMKWNECFFLSRTVVFNNSRIFSTWLIGWFENGCFFFTLEIFIWIICHFECVLHFFFFFVGSFFLMIDVNDDHQYVHPDFFFSIPYVCVCVWINRHRILDTTQFSSKSLFSGYFFFLFLSIWIQCWSSRM